MLLARRVAAQGLRGVGLLVGVLRLDPVQHRVVAAVGADFRQPQPRLIDAQLARSWRPVDDELTCS
ncbi:hypothetical protein PT2222_200069 [Paraburkholderia tropica]